MSKRSKQHRALNRRATPKPDLFEWAHHRELLANHTVRTLSQRTGVSPHLVNLYAELNGYSLELRYE